MRALVLLFLAIVMILPAAADNYNVYRGGGYRADLVADEEERILFILDFSNSMYETLHGVPKVDLMMNTMREILPKINKNTSDRKSVV